MWAVNRSALLIVLAAFVVAGTALVIIGLKTSPHIRTDDGFSQRIFLVFFGAFFLVLVPVTIFALSLFLRHQARRLAFFARHGRPGTARLLACEPTGTEINNIPQYELKLEIRVAGIEPYTVTHRECLVPVVAGKINIGMGIPVLVDPRRLDKISLQWNIAGATTAVRSG